MKDIPEGGHLQPSSTRPTGDSIHWIRTGWRLAVLLFLHAAFSGLSYYNERFWGFDSTGYEYLDRAVLAVLIILVVTEGFRLIVKRWPEFPSARMLDTSILVLFLAYIVYVFWDALTGGLLSSVDHVLHFVRCVLTERDLIPHGQLAGWSSAIGAGIPLNELYPAGESLLYCLLRLVTLGLFSEERSYNLLIVVMYLAFAGCFYRVARSQSGIAGAFFVLLFLILDCQEQVNFGMVQFHYVGMGAIALGVAVAFLAMQSFAELVEGNAKKWTWIALVLASCWAILLHPFCLALLVGWMLIALGILFILGTGDEKTGPGLYRAIGWGALGFAMAFWWWGPFSLSREWITAYGFWGVANIELGREILEGSLFIRSFPFVNVLAVVGIAWGLFQRGLFVRSLALFAIVDLLMCSEFLRSAVQRPDWNSFLHHMQVIRLSFVAKLAGFILASDLLGKTFGPAIAQRYASWMQWMRREEGPTLRPIWLDLVRDTLRLTVCVLLALPLVISGTSILNSVYRWGTLPQKERFHNVPDEPVHWNDYRAALSYILERENAPSDRGTFAGPLVPFRIYVTDPWRMSSLTCYSPYGIVGPYYIPTVLLNSRPYQINEDLLRLANIKYLFVQPSPEAGDIRKLPNTVLLKQFGNIEVYEWEKWNGESWRLDGEGTVAVLENDSGHLRLEIGGTKEDTALWIGISRYRKWKVSLDGEPVPLIDAETSPDHPELGKFPGVRVHDGTLDIRYRKEWIDWAGQIVSSLAFLLFLFFIFDCVSGKRRWERGLDSLPVQTIRKWIAHRIRIPGIVLCVVSAIAILAVAGFFLIRPLSPRPQYAMFLGVWYDMVGEKDWTPDGKKDLEWVVYLRPRQDVELESVTIRRMDTEPNGPANMVWTTEKGQQNKIAVFDDLGRRMDTDGADLRFPLRRSQRVFFYAHNIFSGQPPKEFRASLELHFSNGAVEQFYAP
ncbi:MAG TPA: hypothetical protein PK395_17100 [bacterium]|nr:hypothetical protein [bacterium]